MTKRPLNNPHDRFFKENFSRIDVLQSFVKTYLLDHLDLDINLANIHLFQNDSVDTNLFEYLSDLIFCTETLTERNQLYLIFEHKSSPDQDIGIQIDNYVHIIRGNQAKSDSNNDGLFYIIPVII